MNASVLPWSHSKSKLPRGHRRQAAQFLARKGSTFRVLGEALGRHKLWLALIYLSTLLLAACEGLSYGLILTLVTAASGAERHVGPGMLHRFYDSLLSIIPGIQGGNAYVPLCILIVGLQILRAGIYFGGLSATSYIAARIENAIRQRVYADILNLQFAEVRRYAVGDLLFFISTAPGSIRALLTQLNTLAAMSSMCLGYGLTLLFINKTWTGFVFLIFGPIVFLQRILIRLSRHAAHASIAAMADMTRNSLEVFRNLRLIHAFGQQEEAVKAFARVGQGIIKLNTRRCLLNASVQPLAELLLILGAGVLLAISIPQSTQAGRFPIANLLVFLATLQRLSTYTRLAAATAVDITNHYAPLKRLDGLLAHPPTAFIREGGKPVHTLSRGIVFEDVSLRYSPEHKSPALNRIDFAIHKGEIIAFVGDSGSGKSTLVDLLLGLYSPSEGRITIDGEDLETIDLKSWRRLVGTVSQDTVLFNDTVEANLRWGAPEVSAKELVEAAKLANAHDFITSLPKGYQTEIGDNGQSLSGGQRQRLALARALAIKPQLLVLDEATSALDSESERLIQNALENIRHQLTIVMVAHRLSTITSADRIVVLRHGQIIEQGTHQELITLSGQYAKHWSIQSHLPPESAARQESRPS